MSQVRILKNITESKIILDDLGAFEINAGSQEDISDVFTMEQLYNSSDLLDKINSDDLVVNNGQRDLSAEEAILYCTPSSDKPRENPLPYIYLAQANTLQSLFELHMESMELEESLEKCYVDFLDSKRKITSDSNILYDGQGIYLYGNDITDSTIETFDSISNWEEDENYNNEIASIALDENDKQEGTGSCKIVFSGAGKFSYYGIKRVFTSSQNWGSYENIGIYTKLSEENSNYSFCIVLKNSSGDSFFTNLSRFNSSWSETIFDILGCSFKQDIKEIIILIIPNCSDNLTVNLDQIRISTINTYQSSGYVVSNNIPTYADTDKIYCSVNGEASSNTGIQIQISLDSGINWHILSDSEYEKWIEVNEWNEYENFENLKNIKVKIVLSTSDTSNTSQVDDYFIQWKVKV